MNLSVFSFLSTVSANEKRSKTEAVGTKRTQAATSQPDHYFVFLYICAVSLKLDFRRLFFVNQATAVAASKAMILQGSKIKKKHREVC